jgi:phospholipase/carboxylesterase
VTGAGDAAGRALAGLIRASLDGIARLEAAARGIDPETIFDLIAGFEGADAEVAAALAVSRATDWPERLGPVRACVEASAEAAAAGLAALARAGEAPDPLRAAGRAFRAAPRASEAIYPLAPFVTLVSDAFLTPAARADEALRARIAATPPGREGTGTMHLGGPPGTRGGAAVYVPEYLAGDEPAPLVVALHGGSGNGRDFLWTWLKDARSRGCILIAPTATGDTWALGEPAIDATHIAAAVEAIAARRPVDPARRLLTGMSDGGTFTYTFGLGAGSGFTHLAPVAAAFNRFVMGFADATRVAGLPIRIVHGAQDWMFPVETAEAASRALAAAGARVVYEPIDDLAHAYPREANARILDWFLAD